MSETHQVIAIDLPGFGDSEKPLDASYSLNYQVKILDQFFEALSIKKTNLVVHDLGGPIGVLWAVRNPEKIHRLVLLNTLVYPEFSTAVKLFGLATYTPFVKNYLSSNKGIMGAMRLGVQNKKALNREILTKYYSPFQSTEERKVLLKTVQKIGKKGFIEIVKGLPKIKYPVGLFYGENDRILPDIKKTMDRLMKDIPHAQRSSISDCGHFLQEDKPEEVALWLSNFLQQ